MATVNELEQRIERIEQELATLRKQIAMNQPDVAWIDRVSGSMADIPEFDQLVELGRHFRHSQQDVDTDSASAED